MKIGQSQTSFRLSDFFFQMLFLKSIFTICIIIFIIYQEGFQRASQSIYQLRRESFIQSTEPPGTAHMEKKNCFYINKNNFIFNSYCWFMICLCLPLYNRRVGYDQKLFSFFFFFLLIHKITNKKNCYFYFFYYCEKP